MRKIIIINGPNLNLLGRRQPEIYGHQSFEDYFDEIQKTYIKKAALSYYQSNHEGALIDKLQEIGFSYEGIILNAGGYSHTSIALADCVSAISSPVIEVHISDIKAREPYRHHSFLTNVCKNVIVGKGLRGYREAIDILLSN